jgi:hypothetical protein
VTPTPDPVLTVKRPRAPRKPTAATAVAKKPNDKPPPGKRGGLVPKVPLKTD